MTPIWRPVPGYERFYEVSNTGFLRRIVKKRLMRWDGWKGTTNKDGYQVVLLQVGLVKKYTVMHRLVAMAFLPKPDGCDIVHHKNGVRDDNRVENLEWVTQSDNVRAAHAAGSFKRISMHRISKAPDRRAPNISKHWLRKYGPQVVPTAS